MTKALKAEKDKLIAELIELSPDDKVCSRLYFRQNSEGKGSYERVFGTWTEFVKAAGFKATRGQQQVLNQTAKHASVDKLRELTAEKRQYANKYDKKPSGSRFKTVIVASDLHDRECDPFFFRTFVDTIKRIQPDNVVLNGDIFDLPEFSKYNIDPREWGVAERVRVVHSQLAEIRKAAPNTQIDFVEGNHEARLLKHLAEQSPGMVDLLSELHGMTIPKLLGLDDYQVNYHAQADLAAFTKGDTNRELSKNFVRLYDSVLFGHFPHHKNYGWPGANGHHHSHWVSDEHNATFGPYEWHQLGCGHKRRASYTYGGKWSNGFLICHIDTDNRKTQFNYVDVTGETAMIEGKWYTRLPEEVIYV